MVVIICVILTGIGIYIGRFLRWNSWDILTHPMELLMDLIKILIQPQSFNGSGSIVLFAAFFLLSYLTFFSFTEKKY